MLNRDKIIETIKKMPDRVYLEEVLDRIILLSKIEAGLEQSSKGQVIPDDQLDEQLPEWLR